MTDEDNVVPMKKPEPTNTVLDVPKTTELKAAARPTPPLPKEFPFSVKPQPVIPPPEIKYAADTGQPYLALTEAHVDMALFATDPQAALAKTMQEHGPKLGVLHRVIADANPEVSVAECVESAAPVSSLSNDQLLLNLQRASAEATVSAVTSVMNYVCGKLELEESLPHIFEARSLYYDLQNSITDATCEDSAS